MGQGSASQTALVLLAKLLECRTWRQDELATAVGVESATIRKHLLQLQQEGVPLERDAEAPYVFWSVPDNWGPKGFFFEHEHIRVLLTILVRHSQSQERDRIVQHLLKALPNPEVWRKKLDLVMTGSELAEPAFVEALEDAGAARRVMEIRYQSQTRREVEWRPVSVQKLVLPLRFVAWCHRRDELRWFRLDRVYAVRLDSTTPFHEAPSGDVDELIATSVSGFAGDEPVRDHVFQVRGPEAGWVKWNLPFNDAASVESRDDATLRVTVRARALVSVARYVVGLGRAARAESPELADAVRELAEGALGPTSI